MPVYANILEASIFYACFLHGCTSHTVNSPSRAQKAVLLVFETVAENNGK